MGRGSNRVPEEPILPQIGLEGVRNTASLNVSLELRREGSGSLRNGCHYLVKIHAAIS